MKIVYAAIVVLLALPLPAHAIDFAQPIMTLDNEPMHQKVLPNGDFDPDSPILTLARVSQTALLSDYRDETNLDPVEKQKRFWLAEKIHNQQKDPVLSPEEIATIKKLVAKAYNSLVMGRAWHLLDPTSDPK